MHLASGSSLGLGAPPQSAAELAAISAYVARNAPGVLLKEVKNFEPIDTEDYFTDLEVVGTIPPEMCGEYVRNGPNAFGGNNLSSFNDGCC